jgi:hypothetical protein
MRYNLATALLLATLAAPCILSAPLHAQKHDMSKMDDMAGMKGMHEGAHSMTPGKLPAGWHAHLDDSTASIKDLTFHKVGTSLHFMTGPVATIVWRTGDKATGNFVVSGSFDQMKLPSHPEAYGIVFAGTNLDRADEAYLYFLVRYDGHFLIKHRAGADTHGIVDWSSSPAINKPDANGRSTNVLAVDAGADKIRFMINGKQVAAFARDKPMAANGLIGLRINHDLEVHVNNFKIVRK